MIFLPRPNTDVSWLLVVNGILCISISLLIPFPKAPKHEVTTLGKSVESTIPNLPVRIEIPEIEVKASIQHVGLDTAGNMASPNNSVDVAWYKLGTVPGNIGSAVIAGHLDGNRGEKGIFFNLSSLKTGDKFFVYSQDGNKNTFIVREVRIIDTDDPYEVYHSNFGAHLNLITCNGHWDSIKKSYSNRLVVFSDLVP